MGDHDGIEPTDVVLWEDIPEVERAALSFADWGVREINLTKAMAERAKAQGKAMHAQLMRRAEYIEKRYAAELQAAVDADLAIQPGKKESVNYLFGRAGYRKRKDKVVVEDEQAVIAFCEELGLHNCVRVTKELRITALRDSIDMGAKIPGVRIDKVKPTDPKDFYISTHGLDDGITKLKEEHYESRARNHPRITSGEFFGTGDDVGHGEPKGDGQALGGSGQGVVEGHRSTEVVCDDREEEARSV